MTELLEQAIARIREFAPEVQDDFARVLLLLAEEHQERVYKLTPEEVADMEAADREIERGEFASDEEVRAVFATSAR